MGLNSGVIQFFKTVDSTSADAAIALALRHAKEGQFVDLVDILIERGRPEGLRVLAEQFDTLPLHIQKRIAVAESAMCDALADILRHGEPNARINALSILQITLNLPLAYLVAGALTDRASQVRHKAADTLLAIVQRFQERSNELRQDLHDAWEPCLSAQRLCNGTVQQLVKEREFLMDALRLGVQKFVSHHMLEVVEAAMIFVDHTAEDLFSMRRGRSGSFTQVLLDALAKAPINHMGPFFYVAIERPELRGPMQEWLAKQTNNAAFEALFRDHWRLYRREVRRALAAVHELKWLERDITPLVALPEDVHAAGVKFITHTGLSESRLLELFRGLVDFDAEHAQTAAVHWLCTRRSPEATGLLNAFAQSQCAAARRIAEFELSRRSVRPANSAKPSAVTAGSDWRLFLQSLRTEPTFEGLWKAADRLEPRAAATMGTALLEHVPNFTHELRPRLCGAKASDSILAHRIIAAFRLEKEFESDIFAHASHEDDTIRALAMFALGRLSGVAAKRVLARSLHDPSPRVRSAAVDAYARVDGEHSITVLQPLCEDESPDVRSTAIRVLLVQRISDAARTLITMLRDQRPDHRLSALSLIGRMHLTALRRQVEVIADTDDEERVRSRAARIVRTWDAQQEELQPLAVAGTGV
jgi:HEAT repeat protein